MGVAFVVENKPGASFVPGTMDIVEGGGRTGTRWATEHRVAGGNRTLLPAAAVRTWRKTSRWCSKAAWQVFNSSR